MKKIWVVFVFLFLISFISAVSAPKNCSSSEIKQTWDSVFNESAGNLTILHDNTTSGNTCNKYFAYRINEGFVNYLSGGNLNFFGTNTTLIIGANLNATRSLTEMLANFSSINDTSVINDVDLIKNYTQKRSSILNTSQLDQKFSSMFKEEPGAWEENHLINTIPNETIYDFFKNNNSITGRVALSHDFQEVAYMLGKIEMPIATQQQAERLLNQTKAKIENIKNQTKNYSLFYQNSLLDAMSLPEIERKFLTIKGNYENASSGEDYSGIIQNLTSLQIPSQIIKTKTGTSMLFFPQREDVNLGTLTSITGETYNSIKESTYIDNILSWNLEEVETRVTFNEISIIKNNTVNSTLNFFELDLNPKRDINGSYYWIIRAMNNLKFKENYGQQSISGYYYLTLGSEPKKIEFSTTDNVGFVNLPAFASPRIDQLSIAQPNTNGEAKKKISRWLVYGIILGVLIIIFFVVYHTLQKWYKNKYEVYLFKNRTNLFNILTYINNSRKRGDQDKDMIERLKKAGWNGEQITYAIKKYAGKRTGMIDLSLLSLFKKKPQDPRTPPRPPEGLLYRDRPTM